MSFHSVPYDDVNIEFEIIFRNRKNIKINVIPDGSVQAIVPRNADMNRVKRIVKRKGAWILKQRRYFDQFKPLETTREYVSGETHRYLNRQYRLKIIPSDYNEVKLIGGYFMVRTRRKNEPVYNKKLLYDWYRLKAKERFNDLVDEKMNILKKYNVIRPTIVIRMMKSRWGSCVPAKNKILLNLELIRAPTYCIEYVVLHEMAHLKYPYHNPDFYDFLTMIIPDWQDRKNRLEKVTITD